MGPKKEASVQNFVELCILQKRFDIADFSENDAEEESILVRRIDKEFSLIANSGLDVRLLFDHSDESVRYWAAAISLQRKIHSEAARKTLQALVRSAENEITRGKAGTVLSFLQ